MIILLLVVVGLVLGSFVNALVWRLHEQSTSKKKANDPRLSILNGRSMCTSCRHILAWYDLIPVISWLTLKGRCRYCQKSISWQYPLVELCTAALFIISYAFWPYQLTSMGGYSVFVLWQTLMVGFMALTVYDLRWMLLPNRLVTIVGLIAGAQIVTNSVTSKDVNVIIGSLAGGLIVGGLFYGLFQLSGGRWIGGGDVKLGFVLGMLAGGLMKGLLLIFVASSLGTVIAAPLLFTKKKTLTQKLPFGPFLMAATVFVYLFGQRIIDWYQALYLL